MSRAGILAAVSVCVVGGCLFAGCARSERVASMGLFAPREEPLVLGSGDALGVQIYVNDLVLAARNRQDESQRQALEPDVDDNLESLIDLLSAGSR